MKKYILLTLLAVFISSCSLGPLLPVPTSTPAATQTNVPSLTWTASPTMPTPTFTLTPTLIVLRTPTATLPNTNTPLPTDTLPPMTSTYTPLPPVKMEGFSIVTISLNEIYKAKGCEPSVTRVTAQLSNLTGVEYVLLFARFKSLKAERASKWTSIPMIPLGAGTYIYDLSSNQMLEDAFFETSWIEYQIVSTNKVGREIGRTDIFKGRLKMLACVPTVTPTSANVTP